MPKGKRKDIKDAEFMAHVQQNALEYVMDEVKRLLIPLFEEVIINKVALVDLMPVLEQKGIIDSEQSEKLLTRGGNAQLLSTVWDTYMERVDNIEDVNAPFECD